VVFPTVAVEKIDKKAKDSSNTKRSDKTAPIITVSDDEKTRLLRQVT